MKYTTNYNLKKPDLTDTVNIGDLNANADSIDALLAAMANTVSKNTNGWFKDQKTGLIIQWGSATLSFSSAAANSLSVNFPITFPNNAVNILTTIKENNMGLAYSDILSAAVITSNSASTIFASTKDNAARTGIVNVSWRVIGY